MADSFAFGFSFYHYEAIRFSILKVMRRVNRPARISEDKKKMGNLLIGMRTWLYRQPLTSALPTASGTMLLIGLLSKAPMRSRSIACLHSHGAPFIAHRYAFAPVSFPFAAADAA